MGMTMYFLLKITHNFIIILSIYNHLPNGVLELSLTFFDYVWTNTCLRRIYHEYIEVFGFVILVPASEKHSVKLVMDEWMSILIFSEQMGHYQLPNLLQLYS